MSDLLRQVELALGQAVSAPCLPFKRVLKTWLFIEAVNSNLMNLPCGGPPPMMGNICAMMLVMFPLIYIFLFHHSLFDLLSFLFDFICFGNRPEQCLAIME